MTQDATPPAAESAPEPQNTAPESAPGVDEEGTASNLPQDARSQDGQGVGAPPPSAKEVAAAAKVWKVKIDGVERDVPIDDLVARYQKAEAADQRFNAAAQIRKQAEKLIRGLQTNPLAVLRHPALGFGDEKLQELAEELLYEKVQLEGMSEIERENYLLKKEKEQRAAEEKIQAEQREQEAFIAQQEKHRVNYQKQIMDVLDTAGLPKTSGTVRRIASKLHAALQNDQVLEAKDVVEDVRKEIQQEFNEMFVNAPAEKLIEIFGKDVAAKLRKHATEKLAAGQQEPQIVEPTGSPSGAGERKKMTKDEWRAFIAKRAAS